MAEKILAKDAPLIGYKGLYKMRHDIWDEARQCLMREARDYLDEASYNDRIVTLLSNGRNGSTNWRGSGLFTGRALPPANIALSQLRSFSPNIAPPPPQRRHTNRCLRQAIPGPALGRRAGNAG